MRRYDLDWLRVIVFGLLIFYHVGMFFVSWDFHIKNNVIYGGVKWPMLFVNQWRMPILFMISGMGTCFALSRRNARQFAGERVRRLLIPLIFGMLFIIPPQVYFERLADRQFVGGYFEFWPWEAFSGIYPKGNTSWHHLWFLPYLLLYSLLLTPLFDRLKRNSQAFRSSVFKAWFARPAGWYLWAVPLVGVEWLLAPRFPVTHALFGDWFTVLKFFLLFFYGFLLMTLGDIFWQVVKNKRRLFLFFGMLGFAMLLTRWLRFYYKPLSPFLEALLVVFNFWSWILAIFGYSARYLNRNSALLQYSNTAVYPFYILHQTVTIAIGYYLIDAPWGLWTKASIMIIGTFSVSSLLYELLIKRISWLRPFFGLKVRRPII